MALHQHAFMGANRLLPPDPSTIPGGALNPDPVRPPPLNPHYISTAVAPPGAGIPPAHPFLPNANGPSGPNGPNETIFSFNDDTLAWMNERPYNVLGFLGKGGFGIVHKVELLTPLGWTVKRDAAALPDFEGTKGFAELALERMHSGSIDEEAYNPKKCGGRLNPSGFCFALKKMTPGSGGCDWDDCLREVKLMQALKTVLILFARRMDKLQSMSGGRLCYGFVALVRMIRTWR